MNRGQATEKNAVMNRRSLLKYFSKNISACDLTQYELQSLRQDTEVNFITQKDILSGNVPDGEFFDRDYYMDRYLDVAKAGIDPYLHYKDYGCVEGRFPNGKAERHAMHELLLSDIIDIPLVFDSQADVIDNILEIIKAGDKIKFKIPIDKKFIDKYYPYSSLGHYDTVYLYGDLKRCGLPLHLDEATASNVKLIRESGIFDESLYVEMHMKDDPIIDASIDPIVYYLTEGWRRFKSCPAFSDEYYLRTYGDILRAKICPLVHYLRHGIRENRSIYRISAYTNNYQNLPSIARPTIVFVMHDLSRTGAPLLILSVCKYFSKYYNIIGLTLRSGELSDSFKKICSELHVLDSDINTYYFIRDRKLKDKSIQGVIVNTYACQDVVGMLSDLHIPVMLLVHDFADYLKPDWLVLRNLVHANRAVFPSSPVLDASLHKFKKYTMRLDTKNISLLHQSKIENTQPYDSDETLDYVRSAKVDAEKEGRFMVLGAGTVEIRKGTDLFIDLAARSGFINSLFTFKWIGRHFLHGETGQFLMFLIAQARLYGIEPEDILLKESASFDAVLECFDVFVLSSLLDPFPNVAIDALVHGLPVICFDRGNGTASLSEALPSNVYVVPYRNVESMVETLHSIDLSSAAREKRKNSALKYFGSVNYGAALFEKFRDMVAIFDEQRGFENNYGLIDPDLQLSKGIEFFASAKNSSLSLSGWLYDLNPILVEKLPDRFGGFAGFREPDSGTRIDGKSVLCFNDVSTFGVRPLLVAEEASTLDVQIYIIVREDQASVGQEIYSLLFDLGLESRIFEINSGEDNIVANENLTRLRESMNYSKYGCMLIVDDIIKTGAIDRKLLNSLLQGMVQIFKGTNRNAMLVMSDVSRPSMPTPANAEKSPFATRIGSHELCPISVLIYRDEEGIDCFHKLCCAMYSSEISSVKNVVEAMKRIGARNYMIRIFIRERLPYIVRSYRPQIS